MEHFSFEMSLQTSTCAWACDNAHISKLLGIYVMLTRTQIQ